ncbi:MAG: ECF transporter S component [Lachnotalea sp.]
MNTIDSNTTLNSNISFLAINAMFIALTLVATAFINVKLPVAANGGLIHLGNVPLFIGAILFGKRTGALAGAFGMGLYDLLSGWTLWAPCTFIIVGLMGYVIGSITENHKSFFRYSIAMVAACIIKVIGYYMAEVFLYHNFIAPISSIPGNLIQIGLAAIIVLPIIDTLRKGLKQC